MFNHKFTLLERFLLLIIVVFFILVVIPRINFSIFYFIPDFKSSSSLENRYKISIEYLNNKKFDEYYDTFLASADKSHMSKSDSTAYLMKQNIVKQIVTINNIQIMGNISYIDRTNTSCLDESCSNKKTVRGYKKFIYENWHWYLTAVDTKSCIREKPYEKPPEFDRAISLFEQRYSDKFGKADPSIFNCLDIQYADLNNAEGLFTFDPNKSSLDKLSIYVDNSYKIKDDLLTAFLLSHEINHASNYLTQLNEGITYPCYDQEIAAFQTQFAFLGTINQEEQDSLVGRMVTTDYSNNNPLLLIKEFTDFSGRAKAICGSGPSDCFNKSINDQITNMVKNNPYYQKECTN